MDASFAASIAALLYVNTVRNGFAFDDHRAIEGHPCVHGSSFTMADGEFWHALLTTDFWGTPLASARSHRSFRPLATLSLHLDVLLLNGGSIDRGAAAATRNSTRTQSAPVVSRRLCN